jgi:bisphosphoglycerate-dependent phosphoglycerate mutase
MNMDKRKLLYFLPVFVLLALWLFWPDSEEERKLRQLEDQARKAALSANPQSGEYREFAEQNRRLFTEENMYSFSQLMEMARTGRISLVSELWRLRTKCGVGGSESPDGTGATAPQMNFDECNIRIENFLREQYPAPENEKIIALFRGYLRYEDAMRRFNIPENLTAAERYDFIKKKRREFFSESDAQLIFGFEEARIASQDVLNDFVKNSADMPADQRVKKYYELRRNSLGEYNAAISESEPAYTRYETEVMLRGDEMQRKGNTIAETQALRERYFGAAAAQRMAQVEKEIREERARIESYEAAAQKFSRDNAALSETERREKLNELRVQMLGKEEAEAYERRMQYEEYLRSNNLR